MLLDVQRQSRRQVAAEARWRRLRLSLQRHRRFAPPGSCEGVRSHGHDTGDGSGQYRQYVLIEPRTELHIGLIVDRSEFAPIGVDLAARSDKPAGEQKRRRVRMPGAVLYARSVPEVGRSRNEYV